ncbi:TniB family NTP-binding protein [Kitasatospora gansuensis]
MVKMFAADFEHQLRREHPERFEVTYRIDSHTIDYTPVVYVNIPSQATPKDLSIALANYMGMAYRPGATKSDITDRVLAEMRRCGVQLVIIDDAHFMDLSLKEGKVVNDHLKYIANHTAATFIYTGVDLKHSGLFLEGTGGSRVTQTSGRNTLIRMQPFTAATREDKQTWISVISAMEDALILHRHQPGTLKRAWKYLHQRTGGNISSLAELVREAATEAVLTGTETINRTVMNRIEINEHAQTTYASTPHDHTKHTGQEPGSNDRMAS